MTEKRNLQEEEAYAKSEDEKARRWQRENEIEKVQHWMGRSFQGWHEHKNSEELIREMEMLVGTLRFISKK